MRKTRHREAPRRLLPTDIREEALNHLDRFATTRRRLADLLKRRALRSAGAHGDDPAPLLAAIEATMQWLEARGLLNDRDYAQAKSRSLVERGQSKRRIAARLMGKGVDPDTARDVIAGLEKEFGDTDLAAAKAYAKRRRLGCHRKDAGSAARSIQRDLAAMARAGFSLATARRALSEEE